VPRIALGLAARVAILAAAFFLEKTFLNEFVDFGRAQAAHGFGAFVRNAQHWGFRFLVALAAALALFAYVRAAEKLKAADAAARSAPIRISWVLAHILLVVCLVPLSYMLYRGDAMPLPFATVVVLWIAVGGAAALCAILGLAPWRVWCRTAAALGNIWWYAAIVAFLSASAMHLSQELWGPTATLTFNLVHRLLLPLIPALNADSATRILSTDRFAVAVSDICSGLEGVGLILTFSAAWLIYFRREYIFPRALLLIPLGVAAIFLLNVLRIAALMLIGNAGFTDAAIYGFHSQAGWIAFIAVACAMVLLSRRSSWLNRAALHADRSAAMHNPTAAYLMPLLAILAAGAVSRAISGSFEYFYPLRLIAALAVLAHYRNKLWALDWRFGWRAPAVGFLVFLVWIAAAHYLAPATSMPERLTLMPPGLRISWILARIAGAVLLVPIAEELAYRGYLMRRWTNADFESVPFHAVRWPALIATAVVFGLAHGAFWLPGMLAGLVFGLIVVRRGRLGEAVAAHATANALIALSVLAADQWQLW
jgi:exosortase E/protease (VPEID-CTERM system)